MTNDQADEARLCSECVGEAYLSAEIQSQGAQTACSLCGKDGKTYSIEEVAQRVAIALKEHYSKTPSETEGYNEALSDWERDGEPILQVIQSMVDIDEEPAREILALLHIDHDAYYEDATASYGQLHSEWRKFEESIKTEVRFFSPVAQSILARVFENIGVEKTRNGKAVVVEAGPERTISALFRARVFQSDGKLAEALCRPDLRVGSPPPRTATAGA